MSSSINTYSKLTSYSSTITQAWLKSTPLLTASTTTSSIDTNDRYSLLSLDTVTALKSIRGIDEDRVRVYLENYIISMGHQNEIKKLNSYGLDIIKPIKFDISPSGKYTIHLYNHFYGVSGKEDKCILELIDNSNGNNNRIVASNVHGNFIGDAWFSGISWSFDESLVAYVAMSKQDKPGTYFSSSSSSKQGDSSSSDSFCSSNKFDYKEDWGEAFTGIGDLGLYILNIKTMQIVKVTDINYDIWTVGQPCFVTSNNMSSSSTTSSNNNSNTTQPASYLLAYTAWKNKPRKLGLLNCFQRPTSLFVTDISDLIHPTATSPAADSTNIVKPIEAVAAKLRHILLTKDINTARSPQCYTSQTANEENLLVFLGHEKGFDVHNGCSELFSIRIDDIVHHINEVALTSSNEDCHTLTWRKIVSEVWLPQIDISNQVVVDYSFPGIYTARLCSHSCFSEIIGEGAVAVMSSQWGSVLEIITINLKSGLVKRIMETNLESSLTTTDLDDIDLSLSSSATMSLSSAHRGSCTLLDVKGSKLLYEYSSPSFPPRLALLDLHTKQKKCMKISSHHAIQMIRSGITGDPENISNFINNYDVDDSLLNIDTNGNINGVGWNVLYHNTGDIPFESILIYPKKKKSSLQALPHKSIPLVIVPHGGPHSVVSTSYISSYAYLCMELQAAILHINYRGSPGFGQASILSLPGNIGRNDVDDVMKTLQCALEIDIVVNEINTNKLIDPKKVAIVGGSHGGFLTGHCIGQFPDVFKAAAMRNPVTNIPSMVAVSDIAEALGKYDFSTVTSPSSEELIRMRQCSPIHYIHQVKTPTLICLGGKDRRVPPSQGLEYYHILKQQQQGEEGIVPTKLLIFPEDNHPIDRPASEADHWIAISKWIHIYINK